MPDHSFRCGDILRCVSRYHAEQLNISGLSGMVMGTKPHHIHLWFETLNRSYWITFDILKKAEDPVLTPLQSRIQTVCFALNAEEWELEETPEIYRLLCYIDQATLEQLQDLREAFADSYVSLSLYPEGMGRMIAQTEWKKITQ